jgi:hypothetical protein
MLAGPLSGIFFFGTMMQDMLYMMTAVGFKFAGHPVQDVRQIKALPVTGFFASIGRVLVSSAKGAGNLIVEEDADAAMDDFLDALDTGAAEVAPFYGQFKKLYKRFDED